MTADVRSSRSSLSSMVSVRLAKIALIMALPTLAPRLALEQGCRPYPEGGFRIVTNTGTEGGQEIHHLHLHVMGGPRPWARG